MVHVSICSWYQIVKGGKSKMLNICCDIGISYAVCWEHQYILRVVQSLKNISFLFKMGFNALLNPNYTGKEIKLNKLYDCFNTQF